MRIPETEVCAHVVGGPRWSLFLWWVIRNAFQDISVPCSASLDVFRYLKTSVFRILALHTQVDVPVPGGHMLTHPLLQRAQSFSQGRQWHPSLLSASSVSCGGLIPWFYTTPLICPDFFHLCECISIHYFNKFSYYLLHQKSSFAPLLPLLPTFCLRRSHCTFGTRGSINLIPQTIHWINFLVYTLHLFYNFFSVVIHLIVLLWVSAACLHRGIYSSSFCSVCFWLL